jgi:hypothetical protein
MRILGVAVAITSLLLAGCAESATKTVQKQMSAVTTCRKADTGFLAGKSRTLYTCAQKNGETICVTIDSGHVYAVTEDQLLAMGVSC